MALWFQSTESLNLLTLLSFGAKKLDRTRYVNLINVFNVYV